jgi:hypothetical protein
MLQDMMRRLLVHWPGKQSKVLTSRTNRSEGRSRSVCGGVGATILVGAVRASENGSLHVRTINTR